MTSLEDFWCNYCAGGNDRGDHATDCERPRMTSPKELAAELRIIAEANSFEVDRELMNKAADMIDSLSKRVEAAEAEIHFLRGKLSHYEVVDSRP